MLAGLVWSDRLRAFFDGLVPPHSLYTLVGVLVLGVPPAGVAEVVVGLLGSGGLAYDNGRLFVTGGSGDVLALDSGSGAEIWRSAVKAPVRAAPTIAEGRVLVLAADNQLFALDAGTGAVQWRHAGVFEQAGILGGASPAATSGLVVAAYSSGEVFGLELASGVRVRSRRLGFPAWHPGDHVRVWVDGPVNVLAPEAD